MKNNKFCECGGEIESAYIMDAVIANYTAFTPTNDSSMGPFRVYKCKNCDKEFDFD